MTERVNRDKEPWIDIVKWTACMLVLLGHFFQSMVKSGLMEAGALWQWFDHTVYLFHVPLFFICSGYLYQRNSHIVTFAQWKKNILGKLIALGIPYITFTVCSFILKNLFQGAVNEENNGSLLYTLFVEPMAPYWYLYILFFLFLVTPVLKSKKQALFMLGLSLFIFLFQQNDDIKAVFFIQGIARWEIWFLIGMLMCFYKIESKFEAKYFICSLLLLPMTLWGYNKDIEIHFWVLYSLAGGILGCLFVMQQAFWLQNKVQEKFIIFSRNNTMPIFLMHTIFAAGIRSVLRKAGITNTVLHIVLGIGGSIIFPVISAEIMRKSGWLYFCIKPPALREKAEKQGEGVSK